MLPLAHVSFRELTEGKPFRELTEASVSSQKGNPSVSSLFLCELTEGPMLP